MRFLYVVLVCSFLVSSVRAVPLNKILNNNVNEANDLPKPFVASQAELNLIEKEHSQRTTHVLDFINRVVEPHGDKTLTQLIETSLNAPAPVDPFNLNFLQFNSQEGKLFCPGGVDPIPPKRFASLPAAESACQAQPSCHGISYVGTFDKEAKQLLLVSFKSQSQIQCTVNNPNGRAFTKSTGFSDSPNTYFCNGNDATSSGKYETLIEAQLHCQKLDRCAGISYQGSFPTTVWFKTSEGIKCTKSSSLLESNTQLPWVSSKKVGLSNFINFRKLKVKDPKYHEGKEVEVNGQKVQCGAPESDNDTRRYGTRFERPEASQSANKLGILDKNQEISPQALKNILSMTSKDAAREFLTSQISRTASRGLSSAAEIALSMAARQVGMTGAESMLGAALGPETFGVGFVIGGFFAAMGAIGMAVQRDKCLIPYCCPPRGTPSSYGCKYQTSKERCEGSYSDYPGAGDHACYWNEGTGFCEVGIVCRDNTFNGFEIFGAICPPCPVHLDASSNLPQLSVEELACADLPARFHVTDTWNWCAPKGISDVGPYQICSDIPNGDKAKLNRELQTNPKKTLDFFNERIKLCNSIYADQDGDHNCQWADENGVPMSLYDTTKPIADLKKEVVKGSCVRGPKCDNTRGRIQDAKDNGLTFHDSHYYNKGLRVD